MVKINIMDHWKAIFALSLSIWIVEQLLPNISTHAFIQSVFNTIQITKLFTNFNWDIM